MPIRGQATGASPTSNDQDQNDVTQQSTQPSEPLLSAHKSATLLDHPYGSVTLNHLSQDIRRVLQQFFTSRDTSETKVSSALYHVTGDFQADGNADIVGNLSAGNAASAATPSYFIQRDVNGRAQVADPAVAADIATKNYVDSILAMSLSPVSGYTPSAGDVVQINTSGNIFKAIKKQFAVYSAGTEYEMSAVCGIDEYHILVVYIKYATSGQLSPFGQIFSINPATLALTAVGSPTTLHSINNQTIQPTLLLMDSTHILMASLVSYTCVSVLTVNTTTGSISEGTPVSCSSPVTGIVSIASIPGTSNYLLLTETGTTFYAAVVTFSGYTPTIGTVYSVSATALLALGERLTCAVSSNGGFFVAALITSASAIAMVYGAISGTTISGLAVLSMSETVPTSLNSMTMNISLAEGPLDRFNVLNISGSSTTSTQNLIVLRKKGSAIVTLGSNSISLPLHLGDAGYSIITSIDTTSGVLGIGIRALGSDGNAYVHFFTVKILGGTGSESGVFTISDDVSIDTGAAPLAHTSVDIQPMAGAFIAASFATGTLSGNLQQVGVINRRNNVVGIIDSTGKLISTGVANISGLVTGRMYYADINGNLSTTISEVRIGIAISSTKLLLNIEPGI